MKNQGKTWIGFSIVGLFLMSFTTMNTSQLLDSSAQVHSNLDHDDPSAFIAGKTHSDNVISLAKVKRVAEINLADDFVAKGFKIASFELVFVFEKEIREISVDGRKFNETALSALSEFTVNQKFSIERILVKAPTGENIKIPSISLKITE